MPQGKNLTPAKPYYLTLDLIEPGKEEFLLFMPLSPYGRDNLRTLMIAGNDGDNYGKIFTYRFPRDQQVYGPAQISAIVNQDVVISEQFTLWDQEGSEVVLGKMIIEPSDGHLLYIQPVYLQEEGPLKIPQLKRLIMALDDAVVMAPSLEEAAVKLEGELGSEIGPRRTANSRGTGPRSPEGARTFRRPAGPGTGSGVFSEAGNRPNGAGRFDPVNPARYGTTRCGRETHPMIKRILVGLGGTPFTEVAVRRAVELARAHEAELTGVTVVDLGRIHKVGPVPLGGGAYAQRMVERRIAVTEDRVEQAVSAFKHACSEAGVGHVVERETGDPFDLMISHARYHDLTIFGLKSLFDYGITPEPKDALIRLVTQGVRPILAVSPKFRTVRKALVAYSGSMESAKAMRRFVQMRLWSDLEIEIVHFAKDDAEGKRLLSDAATYCRAHGCRTETRRISGSAETDILSRAQESDADIIVMGNSIRSLMFRHILGSTTLSTILNTDRPLFLAQ